MKKLQVQCLPAHRLNTDTHLLCLNQAKPQDLVAMVSLLNVNMREFPNYEHCLDAFLVQGAAELTFRSYGDLVGHAKTHAAHLVAEKLHLGEDPHDIVLRCNMVPHTEQYDLLIVRFVDAVFYLVLDSMHRFLEENEGAKLNPVVVSMEKVTQPEAASACVEKTSRYLNVLKASVHDHVRDAIDWHLALPPAGAFFDAEGWSRRQLKRTDG